MSANKLLGSIGIMAQCFDNKGAECPALLSTWYADRHADSHTLQLPSLSIYIYMHTLGLYIFFHLPVYL